jgi:hypothetical protein
MRDPRWSRFFEATAASSRAEAFRWATRSRLVRHARVVVHREGRPVGKAFSVAPCSSKAGRPIPTGPRERGGPHNINILDTNVNVFTIFNVKEIYIFLDRSISLCYFTKNKLPGDAIALAER